MTPEIAIARLGNLTASKAAVIMGGDDTKGLDEYISRLAGERLHGDLGEEHLMYRSAKMQDGNDLEPEAVEWAQYHLDTELQQQVFVRHPTLSFVSSTLDALAPSRFPVQIKSPLWHVWAKIKLSLEVPAEYRWQLRWELWCCGLPEHRFVAYHRKGQGVVVTFAVTDSEISQMERRAIEIDARVRKRMELLA